MASSETKLVAAHLSAAILAQMPLAKAKGSAADNAVKVYLEVLDKLDAEIQKRRPSVGAMSGTTRNG